MSPFLTGLLLILAGLAGLFWGYRIFRILLPIIGGIAGYLIAAALFPNSLLLALVIGLVLAVALAIFAYAAWSVMVTVSGAILGGSLGAAIAQGLNLWTWLGWLLIIVLAAVGAYLVWKIRDEVVIILTAIVGAAFVASGLRGWFAATASWTLLWAIIFIVLAVVGILWQWRRYRHLRLLAFGGPAAKPGATPAAEPVATRSAPAVELAAPALEAEAPAAAAVAGAAVVAAAEAGAEADAETAAPAPEAEAAAAESVAPALEVEAPVVVAAAAVRWSRLPVRPQRRRKRLPLMQPRPLPAQPAAATDQKQLAATLTPQSWASCRRRWISSKESALPMLQRSIRPASCPSWICSSGGHPQGPRRTGRSHRHPRRPAPEMDQPRGPLPHQGRGQAVRRTPGSRGRGHGDGAGAAQPGEPVQQAGGGQR